MLFALICHDGPDGPALRREHRPAHLAWLDGHGAKVRLAGPFLDEAGQPIGSLLLIEAEDHAAAQAFAAEDPYARAGLFAKVTIRAWRQVLPKPA